MNVSALRQRYETELFERVLPFWQQHSPDPTRGGFFNNLDRDGTPYDTTKHVWLQARQVWMFSKLYRTVEPRADWLALATLGMDFLRQHARRPDGRVYFALSREGAPVALQRKIFSECFYALALAEHARAADRPAQLAEAEVMLEKIQGWAYDWTPLGREALPGQPPQQSLAVPMILLNLYEEIGGDAWARFRPEVDECLRRIGLHVHAGTRHVFEHVAPDGSRLDGPVGRLLNPGHAIEAAWFVQHWAQKKGDAALAAQAHQMARWSHHDGWDSAHGGLFYFADADGFSPTALEWPMKLWWPHCEALYAHLLHYHLWRDPADAALFEATDAYTFAHFPDAAHGEWFGYLDREGRPTHRFKGGPYKGCFHVPRALYLCWQTLREMEQQPAAAPPPDMAGRIS